MKPIRIQRVDTYPIALPYKTPFRTRHGTETHKVAVIVRVTSEAGVTGWGEASVERVPAYCAETPTTAQHILHDFLMPAVRDQTIEHPAVMPDLLAHIHGHPHTKAGLEAAVWDCFAHTNQLRLIDVFRAFLDLPQHTNERVTVGVVVGLQASTDELLRVIAQRLREGYRTVKLKIDRATGLDTVRAVRAAYPDLPLILDANGDYQLADSAHLQQFEAVGALMIEQPFAPDDLLDHSALQRDLATPLCLDESIRGLHDVRLARQLGVANAINLKPARVGGFTAALTIHRYAQAHGLRLRIGGMLETGIGRAGLLALAALPQILWPSDISATTRYFATDLTPPLELDQDGMLRVPAGLGLGHTVDATRL